jgi:hypothetical protein
LRLVEVRSRAPSLAASGQIGALEAAALAKRRKTMTPTQIRLGCGGDRHLHEVAGQLAELSVLLGDDQAREGRP